MGGCGGGGNEVTLDTKQEWGVWRMLKSFLNAIFHPVSDLDNDPFWNPPNIDKYKLVSREERHATLKTLQHKYPKFKRAYKIHQWIELWNTMNISDEEYKNMFLKHLEAAIKELEADME